MNETRTSIEAIAPSVEEAILKGAKEWGLPPESFDVEVLDEGTKGLLGFGVRQARVRLTVRSSSDTDRVDVKREETVRQTSEMQSPVEGSDEEALQITQDTVSELLQRMGIEARIEAHWGEADAPGKIRPLFLDIHGDDLSILIGRRGETLTALQYITRLIVGKELKRPVAVLIDIEGYRARREQQIRRLAQQMAIQAIETSRTMSLEPMPAYERRVVHIELRDNPDVDTVSVGERDQRKVTIIPR
ncbi:MAG: KH domain-containing protein [Anaerolineales bacterium]|nr:KH domain-containing protein [Anaerolineales bacterium]